MPAPQENPTVKHEALIVMHVRFDMQTHDEWSSGNATERMGLFMLESLRNSNMFKSDFTENNSADVNLSYSGMHAFKTSIASDNRRRPNVWLSGRLESMSEAISAWGASWRTVRKTSPLFGTCQHLDTDGRRDHYVQLPVLPHATMRRVVEDARTNMENNRTEAFGEAVREAAISLLDGMFEDGLPVTHVSSHPEPF